MKNSFITFLLCCISNLLFAQSGIPFLTNQSSFCTSSTTFQGNWQPIGPKSFSGQNMGRIDPVWVDPDDSSHILAGSLSGGLFEKQPQSMNWVPLTNKLPGIGVHDIAVHKNGSQWNQATIVIATSTGINDPARSYGLGIYYSADGGTNWNFDEQFYNKVGKGTPKVSRARFLYNSDGMVAISGNKVLKKSTFATDWGDSLMLPSTHDDMDITELQLAPTNADIFWIAGGGSEPGVLYTTDGGSSWHDVTSELAGYGGFNISLPSSTDAFVYNFYSDQGGSDGYIYHYAYNSITHLFVKQTADTKHPGFVGSNFVVSSDPAIMYTGTIPIYRSIDGGSTWNYSNGGINTGHDDVRFILPFPVAGTTDAVFVGNDGGVSKSIDQGGTWKNLNGTGLAISQFYGMSGIEEVPNLLFGGAQDNHIWKIENGIPSFLYVYNDGYLTESYKNSSGQTIVFLENGPGYSEHNAKLYRKIDGTDPTLPGTAITPDPTHDVPEKYGKPIYKSPITGKFYVGRNDLYTSTDDGDTYQAAGLSGANFNNNLNAVSAFDVSPLDENRIYVAYNASGDYQCPACSTGNKQYSVQLFFHDDNGWHIRTPSLLSNPNVNNCGDYLTCWQQITGVVSDPDDYNKVWITLSDQWSNFETNADGTLKQYKTSGVYFSDSAGLPGTWHAMSTGLPNFYINCIVYQKGTDDVLYVGTDAGVFRWAHTPGTDPWMGTWQCFSSGLPACIVKDLDINYCAGKLRVATYGRGIWESNLFPQTLVTPLVQNTATWNSDQKIYQSVEIPTGQTLTITAGATINMCANTYIKVNKGAKLVLDNATLTNDCGYLWSGIQVIGNPSVSQTAANQGTLIMKNGATISNAYIGVLADQATYTGPDYTYPNGDLTHGGGIIQIDNGNSTNDNFVNCVKDIAMNPYHAPHSPGTTEPANKSYIKRTKFSCTGYLNAPYQTGYTSEFLSLYDVHGVTIQGCTWNGPASAPLTLRGIGVNSADADYQLSPYCNPNISPCTENPLSNFNNLYYGIKSIVGDPLAISRQLKIDKNIFTSCARGIYLSGYQNPIVTRNNVTLISSSDTTYGLYSAACTGYDYDENNFTGNHAKSYGMIIYNSGPYYNLVYKDTFLNCKYGIMTKGENSGSICCNPTPGLEFRCNKFTGNNYDIAVISAPYPTGSIQVNQGLCANGTFSPAGNEFSTGIHTSYNLYKDAGGNNEISYWYRPGSPTQPALFTSQYKVDAFTNCGGTSGGDCPSHFSGGGGGSGLRDVTDAGDSIKQIISGIESQIAQTSSVIDGGNTEALLSEVSNSSVGSSQLKSDLVAVGPYLSDSVMSATITRSNPMTNTDLKNVVVNNSPVGDTIYNLLDSVRTVVANNPAVVASQDNSFSPSDDIYNQVNELSGSKYYNVYSLMNVYNDVELKDSAKTFLLSKGENMAALPYVAQDSDYATAQSIVEGLPELDSMQSKLKQFYSAEVSQLQNGASVYGLDSSGVTAMSEMAGQNSVAGHLALNYLAIATGVTYHEEIPDILPDDTLQEERTETDKSQEVYSAFFTIIPNPTSKSTTLTLPYYSTEGMRLEIYDVVGNLLNSYVIPADEVSISMQTENFKPGIYFCTLKLFNETLGVEKLIIMKD